MANYHLRHEMKQLAVIVAIYAKHGDVETARSLEAAWSFAHTIRKKLEVSSGDVSHVVNRKISSLRQNSYSQYGTLSMRITERP